MTEPLNIPLNVTTANLSGLDAVRARLAELRQAAQGVLPSGPEMAQFTAAFARAVEQANERVRQGMGFEVLPGGGIRRAGYQGSGAAGTYQLPQAPAGPWTPPGPWRAFPAHLPASPFGAAAGGPAGGAAMTQLSTFGTPLQIAHGYQHSLGVAQAQQGLQRAQLIGLMAQMGPQGPSFLSQVSGLAGQAAGGAYGMLHGPARRGMQLAGAVGGVGIYGTLTEAMELYRQRARGIIDTGIQLDLNFARVGKTIDTLRDKYYILAHDSVAAMQAMGRVTGRNDPDAVDAALSFGRAYGIAPGVAGGLAGTLAMRGTGANTMARAFAGARASYGRGGLPMAGEPLLEDITSIAGWGSAAAVPMDVGYYGAWAGFIGGLGQRYREPGQAAATYGQIASGLATAPDPTTQALRIRSIRELHRARVARGLGHRMTFGEGEGSVNVDLRTIEGQRIAMENAPQSQEVLQQYWQSAKEYFGNAGDQAALGFNQFFVPELGPTAALRVRQGLTAGGGPAGVLRRGNVVQEDINAAQRIEAMADDPNFQPQRVQALREPLLEALGKPLVEASNDLKLALGGLAKSMQDGTFTWQDLLRAVNDLKGTMMVTGSLIALGSNSQVGQGIGLGMLGIGLSQTADPALRGLGIPTLDWTAQGLDWLREQFVPKLSPYRTR